MADELNETRRQTVPDPPRRPDDITRRDRQNPGGAWPDADAERAQPGDVLGIERDGETTQVGDTRASEDERRRNAERDGRRPR
jgi:hypothetical protein